MAPFCSPSLLYIRACRGSKNNSKRSCKTCLVVQYVAHITVHHGNSKRLFSSSSAIHEFNCRASSQGTLQRRSSVYDSLRGKSRLIEFRHRQLHALPSPLPRPKTRQSPIMKISVKRGTIFFFDRVSEARHHGRRKEGRENGLD